MAQIKFNCPACGGIVIAPAGSEGRNGRCPKCGHKSTIPSAAQQNHDPEIAKLLPPSKSIVSQSQPEKRSNWHIIASVIFIVSATIIFVFFSLPSFQNYESLTTDATYTIEIKGTPGLEFSGCWGGMRGGWKATNTSSFSGTVPCTKTFEGSTCSVSIQKKEREGTLTVTLKRNGEIIETASTSAEFGVILLGGSN